MANSATAQTALPLTTGVVQLDRITPVTVTIDTTDTDLTVYTPSSGNMAAIVGIQYKAATAHDFIIKFGSTTYVKYKQGATSGLSHSLKDGVFLIGPAGAALKVNSSLAIDNFVIYVTEFALYPSREL